MNPDHAEEMPAFIMQRQSQTLFAQIRLTGRFNPLDRIKKMRVIQPHKLRGIQLDVYKRQEL